MIKIDTVEFKNPILNSSGCWCIDKEQIEELYESNLSGIVLKTCTLYRKDGFKPTNFYRIDEENICFNCKGLPNNGYQYYKDIIIELNKKTDKKPIILSVAINNVEDLKQILKDYDDSIKENEKQLVEINLSCPNIKERIPGYHKRDILELINILREIKTKKLLFGLKMPPIFELEKITKISNLLNKNKDIIKFIVVSNSIPNCYILKDNEPVLSNIYGGLSGKINKYISLSNIRSFRERLDNEIEIIGCGGIETEMDILEYLQTGAIMVQVGSLFYNSNTDRSNRKALV